MKMDASPNMYDDVPEDFDEGSMNSQQQFQLIGIERRHSVKPK